MIFDRLKFLNFALFGLNHSKKSLLTTQKNKIEYFRFLLSSIFILLISWLHMDIKTQKDINFKCVLQAFLSSV